jgi:hypothetical protein
MVWSTAILFAAILTDGVLRVHADTGTLLLLNVVRLALVVALIHPFLTAFHLPGAALVTVLATAVSKGLALGRMKRLMRVGAADLLPWRALGAILAAAVAAGGPALLVRGELAAGPLPVLAATAAVYTAGYVGLLWGLGVLTAGERRAITDRIQWAAARAVGWSR